MHCIILKNPAQCGIPLFSLHTPCVSHKAAPPAPLVCLAVCPPGTSGWTFHYPAERWTPWPFDTSPQPQPKSPVSSPSKDCWLCLLLDTHSDTLWISSTLLRGSVHVMDKMSTKC